MTIVDETRGDAAVMKRVDPAGARAGGWAPLGESESDARRPRLTMLSAGGAPTPMVDAALARIARLSYVTEVLGLPDRHQKDQMEVPSSIGIVTRGVIVPEFTSVAVNDGMGVVVTELDQRDMSEARVATLLTRIGSNAAAHVLDSNRYSLSADDMQRALLEGGAAVLERYALPAAVLDRVEGGARVALPEADVRKAMSCVPWALLRTRLSRSEMGLNFGGNHFLEVQVVDRVLDRATAARWGLEEGRIVVMYHLGPGPFSGTLLHHYSRRRKIDTRRAPFFFLSKLLFHYLQRAARGSAATKWGAHFRRNHLTALDERSEEGMAFRTALAMATNFGFAYRMATLAAIRDALRESVASSVSAELLCDIPHNGITRELRGGEDSWVARHNACRLEPGRPAIVAGAWDVPSYLGLGEPQGAQQVHSYDHGAGHLIDQARAGGRLAPASERVQRLTMTRGRSARVTHDEFVPLRSCWPVEGLMDCLARERVLRSVVRLRPIGNLKN